MTAAVQQHNSYAFAEFISDVGHKFPRVQALTHACVCMAHSKSTAQKKHYRHHWQASAITSSAVVVADVLQGHLRSERKVEMHKVIIVGDGRVGKTSLLRRLRGEAFNENEQSTQGAKMVLVNDSWERASLPDVAEILAEKERACLISASVSGSCRVCKKTFGTFQREHSCSRCGLLVCDKCYKYAPAPSGFCLRLR